MVLGALACAACQPDAPPPPNQMFAGLPVSGSGQYAHRSGFTDCLDTDAIHVRCRRHDMRVLGRGPFEAAVDLLGSRGQSGFDRLTIWSDEDQAAVYLIAATLKRNGWVYCYTGSENAGDQAIFTRPWSPFWVSVDISYYSKRRLRVFPSSNPGSLVKDCVPDESMIRFGSEVAAAAGEMDGGKRERGK